MKQRFTLEPKQLVSGLWLDETLKVDGNIYLKDTILDVGKIIQIQNSTNEPVAVYVLTDYVEKNTNGITTGIDIDSMQYMDTLCRDCIQDTILRFYSEEKPVLQTSIMTDLYATLLSVSENMNIIKGILTADEYTCHHSVNIATLCYIMNNILGMPYVPQEILAAGLLHDIGKQNTPTEILNKNGKLTPEEWSVMKQHTTDGITLIKGTAMDKKTITDGILYHHEKNNGKGYPYGLSGNDIPLIAQIISICDVFDAISTKRPYHEALSPLQTLHVMESMKDSFQTHLWLIFKYMIERFHEKDSCTM